MPEHNANRADDQPAGRVVLDLLAATPGVPADQRLTFGSYAPRPVFRDGHWGDEPGWCDFAHLPPSRWSDEVVGRSFRDPGLWAMEVDERTARLRECYAGEYGVRMTTLDPGTAERLGRWYSGELRECRTALGLTIDIDAAERRVIPPRFPTLTGHSGADVRRRERWRMRLTEWEQDESRMRSYVPTITQAHEIAEGVLPPTVAIDTGGGVVPLYVFTEAVDLDAFGRDLLKRIAARLRARYRHEIEALGYTFDSPPPTTAWVRLPGQRRRRYDDHVVTVLATGPRYAPAELDAVGVNDDRPASSYGYWDGEPVHRLIRPTDWADGSIPPPHPRPRRRGGRTRR